MAMSLSHCRLCGRFVRYLYTVSGQYARKSIQIRPSSVQRQFTSSSVVFCKNEDPDNVKSSESAETRQKQDDSEKGTAKASSTETKPENKTVSENVDHGSKTNKKKRNRSKKKESKEIKDRDEIYDKMESAAKEVASSLKQKGKETESDLLEMLRKHRHQRQDGGEQYSEDKGKEVENTLRSMVSDITEGKPFKQNFYQRENYRKNMEDETTGRQTREDSGYMNEMRRNNRQFEDDSDRASSWKFRQTKEFADYELFPGKGLGIFQKGKDYPIKAKDDQSLWAKLEREEHENFQYNYIPYNAFDEMILLTRENKLWKFPVDNEQGMEAEQEVPFYDHIFLEDLIQDFPKKGPIRNFMELVIIGLSKNPYITVQEKKDHIDWFRNYFTQREDILKEALGDDGLIRTEQPSKDSSVESEV